MSGATSHGSCTLRCSVEKRSMCRDLQKWSKTLLFMIGLENVADRIAGRKKSHRHGHSRPLQPRVLQASPVVEALSSHSNCDFEQHVAATLDDEETLPQDWDPKERCPICTQNSEKEELAKKASNSSHSRNKKEIRAADRTKESGDIKNISRNADNVSMASNSSGQHIDWRSINGSGSFNPMNMFRSGQSVSSPYGSAGNLAAAMFTPTMYQFHDLNQVYFELLNHYKAMAATMTASSTNGGSFGMMPTLPIGMSSLSSLSYPSFHQLVANLGANTSTTSSAMECSFNSDQPLDLTKKSVSPKRCGSFGQCAPAATTVMEKTSTASTSMTVVPSVSPTSKGPASNSSSNGSSSSNKRTYSQADLQAAIDDIRNKKLGTRKASVVYRIPRSTLRNKIYKLGAMDDDQTNSTAVALALGTGDSSPSPASNASVPSRSSRRKASRSKRTAIDCKGEKANENSLSMDQSQLTSPVEDAAGERTTTSLDDSSTSVCSSTSVSSCVNETCSYINSNWTSSSASLTVELAKRQALEALLRSTAANGATRNNFGAETTSYVSTVLNGRPAVKTVLQEAVNNALMENLKLKCAPNEGDVSSPSTPLAKSEKPNPKRNSSRRRDSNAKGAEKSSLSMVKIERPEANSTGDGSPSIDDANDLSKKIRPKRGQYRRYDKDALAAAVHAVRRGEMSVHRAGSHFGVPHSTLEYKVKERNLLRVKKRDMKKKLEEEAKATPVGDETPVVIGTSESSEKQPTTSKSSRSSKSKKRSASGTTPAQSISPLSNEIFNSLMASATSSLDSASNAGLPSKMRKMSGAAAFSGSSSPLMSTHPISNRIFDADSELEPQPVDSNDYSTLQASYEAGFQAALMASALHQLPIWQQTLASTSELNTALDSEGDAKETTDLANGE